MIVELILRNLALIDELRLPFGPGLNLLTGETGSGKSIIIDGMNLVLGERAGVEVIREGADQALAEAAFDLADRSSLLRQLDTMGHAAPDEVLILSREINRGGRIVCRINGRVSTLGQMKELGDRLVEVHGQHEHQTILRQDRQRDLLDGFGGAAVRALRDQVGAAYARWSAAGAALREVEKAIQASERELDFWRFQLAEIDTVRPDVAEEEVLAQQRLRWQHAERLARAMDAVHRLDGDEASAVRSVVLALEQLKGLVGIDPELDRVAQTLDEVRIQLQDAAAAARDYRDRLQFEPESLETIEARLHQFDRLKAKYGGSLASVITAAAELRERLDAVEHRDDRLQSLRRDEADSTQEFVRLSLELSASRATAGRALERLVDRELGGLNMPRAHFRVVIEQEARPDGVPVGGRGVRCGPAGIDKVAFLLAANPQEGFLPINRAASGGELSRVMLALKAILADADDSPTLILDEIDSGIGGETANRVGEKMQRLGRQKQVICVTHLAAIAARADHHVLVSKVLQGGRHVTTVRPLSPAARVDEVARLIAGERLTPAARASARELLTRR